MPRITIDGKNYDTEALPQEASQALTALMQADEEIRRLQSRMAIVRTARNTYAQALRTALAGVDPGPEQVDGLPSSELH